MPAGFSRSRRLTGFSAFFSTKNSGTNDVVEPLDAARATATRRAYQSDWSEFTAWAQPCGLETMPAAPDTVALYIADLAAVATTPTIGRRLASITFAHKTAGQPSPAEDPTVRAVWAGIRLAHGTAPDQSAPITIAMVDALPRDRAGCGTGPCSSSGSPPACAAANSCPSTWPT